MFTTGDTVPSLPVTVVTDDITQTSLSGVAANGPVCLAFFPAAYTETCTEELCQFRDQYSRLADGPGQLIGISTDTPFVLRQFRSEHDLPYPLISDHGGTLVSSFGIELAFPDLGMNGLAQRAVYCLDADLTIRYAWIADDPGQEPPYEEVLDQLTALV